MVVKGGLTLNLQLALDRLTKEECFFILEEVINEIDWIEVGTGVIKEYGVKIISEIKSKYPEKLIVADMKTCDAGKHETYQAFSAGADITTVMAFSADQTILDSIVVSKELNKRVMIDLLGKKDKKEAERIVGLGVDLVSLHIGKDMQNTEKLSQEAFEIWKDYPQIELAVAGGISLETLPDYLQYHPSTIIIGSAITKTKNKWAVAHKMKRAINGEKND